MDCNKEEAGRAKKIAEQKLESKDFAGAHKFALKAHQLCPDLDNISQLLSVCDVHRLAQNKMLGNEKDWYGILQLNQTADEALIKKQYRKFALLLHPDKNKISGAEAAFMLIGEAQSVLLDKQKRALHDMKRRTFKPVSPTNVNVSRQVKVNNFTGGAGANVWGANSASQAFPPQAQPGVPNGKETFWTKCPFCGMRFQYYKEVINRALQCKSCKKPFIAFDMYAQRVSQASNAAQKPHSKQDVGKGKSAARDGFHGQQNPAEGLFTEVRLDAGVGPRKTSDFHQRNPVFDNAGRSVRENHSKKVNGKRGRKKVEESSESLDSSSTDLDEDISDDDEEITSNGFTVDAESQPRRSTRSRRHVSYDEFVSDDDEVLNPSRRPKTSSEANFEDFCAMEEKLSDLPKFSKKRGGKTESQPGNECVEDYIGSSMESEQVCSANSSPVVAPEPEVLTVPDPDFHEFDDNRRQECFSVGQLWAIYDTIDAMPRFYARISKVFSPGFEVKIRWLEPDPDYEHEIAWVKRDLPFSCGKFRLGTTEVTTDHGTFSHLMSWDKGNGRNTVKIFPLKGETWALFKDWDIKWNNSSSDSRAAYEYDFVEVLSEYDDAFGVRVVCLAKLKGFATVFVRKSKDELQIPPTELLRFSHRVPSFRLTGEEGQNVPRGSLELDPAAISMGLEEISLPNLAKVEAQEILCNGSSSESHSKNQASKVVLGIASTSSGVWKSTNPERVIDENARHSCLSEEFELSDSEFFNFHTLRAMDKFQAGQVWALYSDDDGLPKYYAIIKRVIPDARNKLSIQWLEPNILSSDLDLSPNKKIPISCGSFRTKIGKLVHLPDSALFSHQLQAERMSKKSIFTIYPWAGDVWAIHKNRNPDYDRSEYDIAEVLEHDDFHVKVLFLERLMGFISVFKPRMDGQSIVVLGIPGELHRFSHQVPCFRLTDEKGGSLRGFFELDPAALPPHMVSRN